MLKSTRRFTVLAIALVAGLSAAPALAQNAAAYAPASADTLTTDAATYRQHIFTLANPWFEGRCPGDRGNADAADYLEFHLKRAGLTPVFPEDGKAFTSYQQPFTPRQLRGSMVKAGVQTMSLALPAGVQNLESDRDVRALAISGSGKVSAPVVFVGYGVTNGQDGYESFQGSTDLKGKIALLMRYEPVTDQGVSKWAESGWSPRAALANKVAACFSHGAAAVVLVNPPGVKDERAQRLMNFTEAATGGGKNGPVMMLSNDVAAKFVAAADASGRSFEDLRKIADASGEMIELPRASITLETRIDEPKTSNVAGLLRGKGALADEYIVIGAHYDHVGYGDFGSASNSKGVIHPGADDNGSGTSGMLTAAKKLAEYYAKLPADANCRSVILMGFSAEESGLEGSAFYCKNLVAPKDKHYLMLNMDMIGRLRDEPPLEVSGLGVAPGLADWLKPYWDNAGFAIRPLTKRSQFDGRSDHASFHAVKIPAIFFFTGIHEDYHRPIDTADKINIEGAVKIVDLVCRITIDASTRTTPLTFGDGPKTDAPAAPAQAVSTTDTPSGSRMGGVRFGIAPEYGEEGPGVVAGEVYPETPAAKAGLKKNDRLLTWNGDKIADVEAFTAKLGSGKPGDKVKITYQRDGKEAEAEVTLEARRTPPTGG